MNIVGLNFSIDSAATLLKDGKRIAASTEERFSRIKHDRSFPGKALNFCLKQGGISTAEVDSYAFFWNPGRHLEPMLTRFSSNFRHHAEYLYSVPNFLLQQLGQPGVAATRQTFHLEDGRELLVHYVDHHDAHAAAAFFNSPFERAAILTVDGYGERTTTAIYRGAGNSLEPVMKISFPHSIGSFYAAVTQYLGFKANSGEGKVMGLASYGDDSLVDRMTPLVRLTDQGFELDLRYFSYFTDSTRRYSPLLVDLLGPAREPESELTSHHENIAFALQKITENLLVHMSRLALQHTNETSLCISGGVALNCVGNRRIIDDSGFGDFFILPPAGDAGTSLGAAQYVSHVLHQEPRDPSHYSDYLGASSSAAEIEHAIKVSGAPSRRISDTSGTGAKLLAAGKIVGWYQGRTEFGPRALGNRSIVADPRSAEMKDILNARVKFREPFRPFAPACLEESCGDLFDSAVPSPFMLRVYDTLPHRQQDLASITHVDGGARVQTVNEAHNPRYYNLIKEFGRLTGVDCILNTSFNIRGEPIVNTVKEALFCFFGTDMDYLIAGDFIVAKSEKSLADALSS